MRTTALALSLTSLLLAACQSHEASGVGREPDEYLGCATDELWPLFDQHAMHTVSDAATAPTLTAPTLGATLAASPAPRFTWTKTPTSPNLPDGDAGAACPQFTRGSLDTAHLPAVTGSAYQIKLFDGATNLHRVITTLERWQPPAALWQGLAGKTIRFELQRMTVDTNERVDGPFQAPGATTFTVSPGGT